MTVIENEDTKSGRVSQRAIWGVRPTKKKNHNFTDLQKQVSTKGENTSTVSWDKRNKRRLTEHGCEEKHPWVPIMKDWQTYDGFQKMINPEKTLNEPRNRLPPLTGSRWQTLLEWKETSEGSRPKANIHSQVVKSMIGFGAVVKRVSVEADRCRTAAELLKRSCLIPEQARKATWPISGASGGGQNGEGRRRIRARIL